MNESNNVEFCGTLKRETEMAYCVHDGFSMVWIPKSQVIEKRHIGSKYSLDYVFIIPEWLAIEKEIV